MSTHVTDLLPWEASGADPNAKRLNHPNVTPCRTARHSLSTSVFGGVKKTVKRAAGTANYIQV